MEPRVFHGDLTPSDLARALVGEFNRGSLRAQQLGSGKQVVVQIATPPGGHPGGQTALSVNILQVEDGVAVTLGKQDWLSVAASLGKTAFSAWLNPWNLVSRLDDIAQDVENMQLGDEVWKAVEAAARAAGASFELSERLKRLECPYCHTANPVGEPNCIACGAPLGDAQPRTCLKCGFVLKQSENPCPNCGQKQ